MKQTRRRTRNSYCASGNPIFFPGRSLLPFRYRELGVCRRHRTTGSGNSARRLPLLSHPASRPISSRLSSFVLYICIWYIHNECRASQLYRVCGRASRFPRTTLAPNPLQPFGSLFSDSKPSDLQHPPLLTSRRDVGEKLYACSAFFASTCISSGISLLLQLASIVALTRLLTASLIPFIPLSSRSRNEMCVWRIDHFLRIISSKNTVKLSFLKMEVSNMIRGIFYRLLYHALFYKLFINNNVHSDLISMYVWYV